DANLGRDVVEIYVATVFDGRDQIHIPVTTLLVTAKNTATKFVISGAEHASLRRDNFFFKSREGSYYFKGGTRREVVLNRFVADWPVWIFYKTRRNFRAGVENEVWIARGF